MPVRNRIASTASRLLATFLVLIGIATVAYSEEEARKENANRHVHDPCIIRQGDYYYVFSTGPGVLIRRSIDLIHWDFVGRVFTEDVPAWAHKEFPDSTALWAPDISFTHGQYRLYYSVSTFGKNRSFIGLATNKTLDPTSPDYKWVDEEKVFESFPRDNYNAIDPNVINVGRHESALTFGSYWSGIKLLSVDQNTGKPAPDAKVVSLSQRPFPDAEEAPFLIRHGRYFYLFVSFDACCQGVNSTYNVRIGRSHTVEGPYVDRDGKSLLEGGGTILLSTRGRYIGPGHCAVLQERKRDLLINHFYDGDAGGIPTLMVSPLRWEKDDWPTVGSPIE